MTTQEWDKIYKSVTLLYQNWDGSVEQSLAWFNVLREFEKEDVVDAFEKYAMESETTFAPNVFQIKKLIIENIDNLNQEQVDELWERVIYAAAGGRYSLDLYSEAAIFAIRAIGGFNRIGNSERDEHPFLKRDFVRAYTEYSERSTTERALDTRNTKRLEQSETVKQLANKMRLN